MRFLYLLTLILLPFCINAQLNTELVGRLEYEQEANDIWGWVAEDGTEYALVGTQIGTSVVSLSDPSNPVEVGFIEGPSSTWRDIKTWGNYAYVTHDNSSEPNIGLHVIDLSQLPDTVTATTWMPTISELGTLSRCHNIYIDEFGVCYLAGCDVNSGGILFVDITSTPGFPQFMGAGAPRYAHDVYVKDNLMFASEVYNGDLTITDVTNKINPILLATQETPFAFTHNAWATEDNLTVFTTDERANAPVAAYDISDLEDIKLLDEFRPAATLGNNVIPHNVHVLNDFLIISHYTDGVVIVDASLPEAMIEMGNYDTWDGGDGGFSGAWGAYPFLPSGLILVSDIQNGLYVINPTYRKASFVRGVVKDAITRAPIPFVDISVSGTTNAFERTDNSGAFTLGYSDEGDYRFAFSKQGDGYSPAVIDTVLQSGAIVELEIFLRRKGQVSIVGEVLAAESVTPLPNAKVLINTPDSTITRMVNSEGIFRIDDLVEDTYELIVTAWGYQTVARTINASESNNSITIQLEEGYYDDFVTNLGWRIEHDAREGKWELATPSATIFEEQIANPDLDWEFDFGTQCYVTGNGMTSATMDDLDDGTTTLISPPMDLSNYSNPVLSFAYWFFNEGGETPPNDVLEIWLSNGTEEVLIEKITDSKSEWRLMEGIVLNEFLPSSDSVQVIFIAKDEGAGHIVESAIDRFQVEDLSTTNTSELNSDDINLQVYPNPFADQIFIRLDGINELKHFSISVKDVVGKEIFSTDDHNNLNVATSNWSAGIYFIEIIVNNKTVGTHKIIKGI